MKKKIDAVDLAILKILQADSDKSQKEIAAIVCISSTNVAERIKWLKEQNYILCTRAILNHRKLNMEILVCIMVKLADCSDDTLENFYKEINQIKEVCDCWYITGRYNIKLTVLTTDTASCFLIERLIAKIAKVQNIESQLVLSELIPYSGFDF